MAKLSEEMLEEGRDYLHAKDMGGFMKWVDRSRIMIKKDVLHDTLKRCIDSDDIDKAIKMFDAGFVNADTSERTKVWAALLLVLGVIAALLTYRVLV